MVPIRSPWGSIADCALFNGTEFPATPEEAIRSTPGRPSVGSTRCQGLEHRSQSQPKAGTTRLGPRRADSTIHPAAHSSVRASPPLSLGSVGPDPPIRLAADEIAGELATLLVPVFRDG